MFRRFTKSRKRTIASLGVVAAMGIAGAAIAYFTSTGSGTGTATVGSSTALTITQTGSISGLTPGGPLASVAYTINNTSAGSQKLGVVSVTGLSVSPSACATSNFTTLPATTPVGTIIGGGTFTSLVNTPTGPTVQMIDSGNQDACQNAVVTLTLSAAQGS